MGLGQLIASSVIERIAISPFGHQVKGIVFHDTQALSPADLSSVATNPSQTSSTAYREDGSSAGCRDSQVPRGPMELLVIGATNTSIKQVHARIAQLIVNNKLPLQLASSPDITALIQAAMNLKKDTYEPMTRRKMDRLLMQMFATLCHTHALYLTKTTEDDATDSVASASQDAGWLTVCHDGWDSNIKQFFGVSIFFVNPSNWERIQIALGLAMPEGHSVQACLEATHGILARYGVTPSDIFCAVNDTTTAAVATGRRLGHGEDGNCMMHMCNLVAEHALGKRTRSLQKQIVDEFPEMEALRKKVQTLAKFITSKKAKQRFKQYKLRNENVGKRTIKIGLDNDTRISGTHQMFQQVIRSRYCIPVYFNQELPTIRENTA